MCSAWASEEEEENFIRADLRENATKLICAGEPHQRSHHGLKILSLSGYVHSGDNMPFRRSWRMTTWFGAACSKVATAQ